MRIRHHLMRRVRICRVIRRHSMRQHLMRRNQRSGNIGGAQRCNGFVGAASIHVRMNGGDVGRREATLQLGQLLASAA